MTASEASDATQTAFGASTDGGVSIVDIVPSSFQGFAQPQTIAITLAGPVTSVRARGQGAIQCSGSYGQLIAYDSVGAEIGRSSLQLIDPSDCSPSDNADNVTFGAMGTVTAAHGFIARVDLTPMSPLVFPVFNLVGHASATYSFSLAGRPPAKCEAPVTSFGQAQGGWELEQYDHISKTIKQKGCAMTSVAMALSTFGFVHDPGELNSLLNEDPDGYVGAGKVNWSEAVRLGSGGQLRYTSIGSADQMEKSICAGNPVIVGVKLDARGNPGHFVLVNKVNGDGSFQVVDPGHGDGTSHPLSDFVEGYSLRGAVMPVKGGASTPFGISRRNSALGLVPGDTPLLFVSATNGSIVLTDPSGARTVADPLLSVSEIKGSSAFVDRIDDDDQPFEIDGLPVSGASVPLDGTRYVVVVQPSSSGSVELRLQGTTEAGTSPVQRIRGVGSPGVPLAIEVSTTSSDFHAAPAAEGYVGINRSCGRVHKVTNSNGLPLDLTYIVEGSSEHCSIHLEARPPYAAASSTTISTDRKGRIVLFSQGREVYRADVPPGCE